MEEKYTMNLTDYGYTDFYNQDLTNTNTTNTTNINTTNIKNGETQTELLYNNLQSSSKLHTHTPQDTTIPARVTSVLRGRFGLVCNKENIYGQLKTTVYHKGNEQFPTVGDFVLINFNSQGDSIIVKTLKRKTFFSRLDPSSAGYGEQAVAANFDYVFIMQSLNKDFNLRKLERYLTLAWQSGATPVVVLTKADLVDDFSQMEQQAKDTAIGAEVVVLSAKTGFGLDELSKFIEPKRTIVFLGSSGVGKSSLVNALADEQLMDTKEIREYDSRGRHTTTHRQLIMLKSGAMIIDTPGMRELGMWDVTEGINQSFADVEQFFGQCRFSDCQHQSEPGCKITEALRNGELSQARWESYQKLKKEARYSDSKKDYLDNKKKQFKAIAKWQKELYKGGHKK